MEPKQRRSKQRRSSLVTPIDKPQARKKTKMMKKEAIDLSDEEAQEVKREKETNFAEGTSQAPEFDIIDHFRKSMTHGKEIVVPIL
ncbi:hypothetical protein R1flu_012961 [Riccia fluitans]|uniref:Uncharacterized protein n=1 Tax=Riccia fluitans TaxID=41844 RepID=A0ABD1ZC39_9MARC